MFFIVLPRNHSTDFAYFPICTGVTLLYRFLAKSFATNEPSFSSEVNPDDWPVDIVRNFSWEGRGKQQIIFADMSELSVSQQTKR